MGPSPAKVYTTPKTFLVENFKHECKNDMVINVATFFAGGVFWKTNFLDNLKSFDKKPDIYKPPT